jgi:hypothetical protein
VRRVFPQFISVLLPLFFFVPPGICALPANPELQRILNNDPDESKRLDAFSKLETANAIDAQQVIRSITDTSPIIRANALRIGTPLAAQDPELEIRLLALANDRTSPVRLQLLACLPSFRSPKRGDLFIRVLSAEIENPKAWGIVLSTQKDELWSTITRLVNESAWTKESPGRIRFLELAANAIRENEALDSINALLTFAANDSPPTQRWCRLALLRGLLGRPISLKTSPPKKTLRLEKTPAALKTLLTSKDSEIRKILLSPGQLLTWPEIP